MNDSTLLAKKYVDYGYQDPFRAARNDFDDGSLTDFMVVVLLYFWSLK